MQKFLARLWCRQMSQNPQILGLTGSFGSGCSYIATNILKPSGYEFISLSEILKEMYRQEGNEEPLEPKKRKRAFQDYGDLTRRRDGKDVFAKRAIKRIQEEVNNKKWIVDSIRNPAEIKALRIFSSQFYLFGISAERNKRWMRVRLEFENDFGQFEADDHNDQGDDSPEYGQKVGDCFQESDVVITNDEDFDAVGNTQFQELNTKVQRYINLITNPLQGNQPPEEEVIMAMAYALSQRSSCMQRKVGAIIVDENKNVISSGYNEVPKPEDSCRGKYTKCYRKYKREKFYEALIAENIILSDNKEAFEKLFKENFKILDLCRALHAEENAILNLARNSVAVNLEKCTIYTTTHPCGLCANKIAHVGIQNVVYLEPYPDSEAVTILEDNDINRNFFEGITSRAFFRLYGGLT